MDYDQFEARLKDSQIVPLLAKASLAPEQISQGSALHGTGRLCFSLGPVVEAPASLVRQLLGEFRMLTSEVVLETRQLSEQGQLQLLPPLSRRHKKKF